MLALANLVVFGFFFCIWQKGDFLNVALKIILFAMVVANAFATYNFFYP